MYHVLQVMNYSAPYRGNFIESLETLREPLQARGGTLVYLFPAGADQGRSAEWVGDLVRQGHPVYFMTGSVWKDARLIRSLIKRHQIDIVHTHFTGRPMDMSVQLACVFTGVKKIKHYHAPSSCRSALTRAGKRLMLNRWLLIGVSESVTEGLRRDFPRNKSITLENGIAFARLDQYETLQPKHPDSVNCMMMGYNYYIKGVDLTVRAVAELRREFPIELYIPAAANEGALRENVTALLGAFPDWITVLPPRNDIASYYHMADIFISSSRSEGFCYAVVEAAYCGNLILASKIPGQGDLKVPRIVWFAPEDTEDLKNQLRSMILHKDALLKHTAQTRRAVQDTYDISVWTDKMMRIYESLTARTGD